MNFACLTLTFTQNTDYISNIPIELQIIFCAIFRNSWQLASFKCSVLVVFSIVVTLFWIFARDILSTCFVSVVILLTSACVLRYSDIFLCKFHIAKCLNAVNYTKILNYGTLAIAEGYALMTQTDIKYKIALCLMCTAYMIGESVFFRCGLELNTSVTKFLQRRLCGDVPMRKHFLNVIQLGVFPILLAYTLAYVIVHKCTKKRLKNAREFESLTNRVSFALFIPLFILAFLTLNSYNRI